jgi:hypothetical protein
MQGFNIKASAFCKVVHKPVDYIVIQLRERGDYHACFLETKRYEIEEIVFHCLDHKIFETRITIIMIFRHHFFALCTVLNQEEVKETRGYFYYEPTSQ